MELKEFLINNILKLRLGDYEYVNGDTEVLRKKAIEYIKEKNYTLSEENILYAMKKIKDQGVNEERLNEAKSQIENLPLDSLIDNYNLELTKALSIPYNGSSPENFLLENEGVVLITYTFMKLDGRVYADQKNNVKDVGQNGLVGRIYITDSRIIMNHISGVYPIVSTVSFNKLEVCSYAITGLFSDELEIVLKSGQKINVAFMNTHAEQEFNNIVRYTTYNSPQG